MFRSIASLMYEQTLAQSDPLAGRLERAKERLAAFINSELDALLLDQLCRPLRVGKGTACFFGRINRNVTPLCTLWQHIGSGVRKSTGNNWVWAPPCATVNASMRVCDVVASRSPARSDIVLGRSFGNGTPNKLPQSTRRESHFSPKETVLPASATLEYHATGMQWKSAAFEQVRQSTPGCLVYLTPLPRSRAARQSEANT